MKAQINLEFIAAAGVYLAALLAVATIGQGTLPDITESMQKSSLHLEAKQVSNQILTQGGRHSFQDGGTHWETNNTTVRFTNSFGLASGFMEVDRDKLERIRTINPRNGFNHFNYSQFRSVTDVDNQYQFTFVWMPIIETHRHFTRGSPPDDPDIKEPNTEFYEDSANRVHFGSARLNNSNYFFLVTSQDGRYNTTYVSRNWDFRGVTPRGEGDSFDLYGEEFSVEGFQNRLDTPGAMLVVSQQLKEFGASPDSDSTVIRLDRYATMENEPLKVEVLSW